jgi:hypothetical protein
MKYFYLSVLLFANSFCFAQQDSIISFENAYKRVYHIAKLSANKPVIDGKLDDPVWNEQGQWSESFVQVAPYERRVSPSFTRVKLFYDDKGIYAGFYCKEAEPEKMNRFIGDRDNSTLGDLVSIAFDTYHDFRAASEFALNLGGNKTDQVITDKQLATLSWNAVWEGRTHVNTEDSSWTAELRIPFSQLRYNQQSDDGVWGVNVTRTIRHSNEVQNWSMIPLKNNGYVFSFGELHGMNDLPKSRGIEFLPYLMGKYRNDIKIPGSPYQTGQAWNGNVGLDAKFSLSDYTFDLTINPDYGQVELDPSVMNLTTYETFYEEKRPFFLEGKYILDFSNGTDMMFYTRRIGSSPSYRPFVDNVSSFAQTKENVPIIGALKLTGTNQNGLTIGIVQSVTARSSSKVTRNGSESSEVIEPLTNYTIGRVQKNWKGNTLLGGMITSVNRVLDEPHLKSLLISDAFAAGIDFTQYFNNRLYYLDVKAMFSSLKGSKEAITTLQTSPTHYYQRESAQNYLGVDPNRTLLSGTGGSVQIGRKGNAKWTFAETFSWYSPGFDLNTVGYMREADMLSNTTEISYRKTDLWWKFRSNTFTLMQNNIWNFVGTNAYRAVSLSWLSMLLNRFELSFMESYSWNRLDTRMLRSGPDVRYDPTYMTMVSVNSDRAKRLMFMLMYNNGYNSYSLSNTLTPSVTLRMGNRMYLSGQFNYAQNTDDTQYVTTDFQTSSSPKYILGKIDQRTYGITLKFQMNVTPDISIQFYGAPFTSTAKYNNFKIATQPADRNRSERFHIFTPNEITHETNGFYTAQYEGNTHTIMNPDFSFNEFRSNVVARWEYRPGSTLYLVWEHTRSNYDNRYVPDWGSNLNRMFGLAASNVFMVKLNYWFGM